jgi:hypothetical protein
VGDFGRDAKSEGHLCHVDRRTRLLPIQAGTPRQSGAVIGDICNRSESDRVIAPLTRKFRGHRPNPRLNSSTAASWRALERFLSAPDCGAGNGRRTPRPHEYSSQHDHRALHEDQRRTAQRALCADAAGVLHDFVQRVIAIVFAPKPSSCIASSWGVSTASRAGPCLL